MDFRRKLMNGMAAHRSRQKKIAADLIQVEEFQDVPWWVYLCPIEEFHGLLENYHQEQKHEMVELRRKLKNMMASHRSRLKRLQQMQQMEMEMEMQMEIED